MARKGGTERETGETSVRVELELRTHESSAVWAKVNQHDFDVAALAWVPDLEIDVEQILHSRLADPASARSWRFCCSARDEWSRPTNWSTRSGQASRLKAQASPSGPTYRGSDRRWGTRRRSSRVRPAIHSTSTLNRSTRQCSIGWSGRPTTTCRAATLVPLPID